MFNSFTLILTEFDRSALNQVTDMLDRLYSKFDALADKYSVYKIETIGDGSDYVAAASKIISCT